MMARYINADDCINTVDQSDLDEGIKAIVKSVIRNTKTADAVEVKRGKWELYGDDDSMDMIYWCSCCRFHLSEDLFYKGYENGSWIENNVFKFCPNCGANMKGGAE